MGSWFTMFLGSVELIFYALLPFPRRDFLMTELEILEVRWAIGGNLSTIRLVELKTSWGFSVDAILLFFKVVPLYDRVGDPESKDKSVRTCQLEPKNRFWGRKAEVPHTHSPIYVPLSHKPRIPVTSE